jgi:transcriptional regulator with XRE-family HTH domain
MLTFGAQLRASREDLGLSVREAAQRLQVEPAQVRMWEADTRTPAPERQASLLAALSVPLATPDMAEYQRGALWALGAMHETLGRLYRELAQPIPATSAVDAERQQYAEVMRQNEPTAGPASADVSAPRRRRRAAP